MSEEQGLRLAVAETKTTTSEKDVTKQVQERLAMADKFEEAAKEALHKVSELESEIMSLRSQLKEWQQLDLRKEQLDEREKTLDSERALFESQKELQTLQLRHADQRVEDHRAMVQLVFRNTMVRKSVSMPVAVPPNEYGPGYVSKEEQIEETTME